MYNSERELQRGSVRFALNRGLIEIFVTSTLVPLTVDVKDNFILDQNK